MTTTLRKQSNYIYYGQTTSLCEECLDLIPTKIVIEDSNVYFLKRCKEHGIQKTQVSSDVDYFHWCKSFLKPGDRPLTVQTKIEYGCPLDCGLCPDHEQHSCLALIDINQKCNLECPVCFADSSPAHTENLSLSQIEKMLDTLVASEGEPDVLQISGGEPTIHPQIMDVLRLAKSKPIRHVMLNTNGIRIAKDMEFVSELATLAPGFEIYLQFDSLEAKALKELRGADLTSIRQSALENLEKHNISTSLVVTVKKGVNDHEIGAIIEHALDFKCVRGITFQPIQDAGRNAEYCKDKDRLHLTDVRRAIYEQSDHFQADDIIPLPCNPESIAIAYGIRNGKEVTPITSLIPKADMVAEVPNAISFEKNEPLRQRVEELFSLSTTEANSTERMESLLCCLPETPVLDNLGYENIFRITIIQFLDRFNFCVGNVKRSCIHFVTQEDEIIPFDTYNLFYRNNLVEKLRARQKGRA